MIKYIFPLIFLLSLSSCMSNGNTFKNVDYINHDYKTKSVTFPKNFKNGGIMFILSKENKNEYICYKF